MRAWLYCKMMRRGFSSAALQLLTAPHHKVTGNFKCGKGAPFLERRVGETGSRWKISIHISRASPIKLTWRRDKKGGFIFSLIKLLELWTSNKMVSPNTWAQCLCSHLAKRFQQTNPLSSVFQQTPTSSQKWVTNEPASFLLYQRALKWS